MSDMNGGWGQPPQNQPYPQYGQAPYGQPQYGQPSYGQPPGAIAPYYGGPQSQVPATYKNVGIMMLISGIKGALISFILVASLIWICVGAFWVLTLAGAIVEIVFGAMIMSGKVMPSAKGMAIVGLINGILCGNIIGVVLEAIAISHLSKPEIAYYLASQPRA